MFEPRVPDSKLYPTDSKEMVGKEEWVAEKAIEICADSKLMFKALEWDGENTGSEDVYSQLAEWSVAHFGPSETKEFMNGISMGKVLSELAERYAEYVLLPAHIEKMKNGDFAG